MTPDQRLDRAERMLILFVKAGRRARKQAREQDERISIIIKTHQETEEIMKGLALGQARANQEIAELRRSQKLTAVALAELTRSQKLTDRALRDFINSLRNGGNGNSSQ